MKQTKDNRTKEFEKLQKENEKIRKKINCFCDDFKMEESRKDLWLLINSLVENELEQEELCD